VRADPPRRDERLATRRAFLRRVGAALGGIALAPTACDPREFARAHGATLQVSIATGNTGGVFYPYGGAMAAVITAHVAHVAATAEVTGGSIDNLQFIRQGTADLAFTTADVLDEAAQGTGMFATVGRVPVLALAVLYDSYLHVATLADTGVRSLADLRGRTVSTGSAGSATEVVALRVLRAAGLDPDRDVRRQGLGVGPAVDALRDGKIDALIWIGGVPTAAVLDLASTPGRRLALIPSAETLPALRMLYGEAMYRERIIPRGAYRGVETDVAVVGLANLLVADARMSEALAYEVTRALFEHRDELVAVHPEARNLALASAVDGSPVGFHAGAVRYYTERGVWKTARA
jgi:hypothetical protein